MLHGTNIRRSSIRRYSLLSNSPAYSALSDLDLDDIDDNYSFWAYSEGVYEDCRSFFASLTFTQFKEYITYFTDNFSINISFDHVMLAFTIFALFGRDIQVLSGDKTKNNTFDGLYTACFALFLFELIANSISKTEVLSYIPFKFNGYLFSFYWWMDFISLLSLFPDVSWIAEGIGSRNTTDAFGGANNNLVKAGRVVRLVRVIRLLRLYRIAYERRKRKQEEKELMELVKLGLIEHDELEKQKKVNDHRTSELGAQLSKNITQKVILMVILMIIVLPLLSYTSYDSSSDFAIKMLHAFNVNDTISTASKDAMVSAVLSYTDSGSLRYSYMLKLQMTPYVSGYVFDDVSRRRSIPPKFRYSITENTFNTSAEPLVQYESSIAHTTLSNPSITPQASSPIIYTTSGLFTRHYFAMLDSQYNILLTIFITIMMVVGAYMFTSDAEKFVLLPIERMMNVIESVARNPLAPISFSYGGAGRAGTRSSIVSTMSDVEETGGGGRTSGFRESVGGKRKKKDVKEGDYEMKLLESTIEKVTALLRIGFGEAGAGIISHNLRHLGGGGGPGGMAMINPLLPGVRVYAIFGFCDIHRFEEATQKLGRDVLLFVNKIAEIVHSQVHDWGGQCNKNLGNAFVMVWRIGDEKTLIQANTASILTRNQQNQRGSIASTPSQPTGSSQALQQAQYSPTNFGARNSVLMLDMDDEDDAGRGEEGVRGVGVGVGARQVDLKRVPGTDEIADRALTGFLKVIAQINRSRASLLQQFRQDRLKANTQANNSLTMSYLGRGSSIAGGSGAGSITGGSAGGSLYEYRGSVTGNANGNGNGALSGERVSTLSNGITAESNAPFSSADPPLPILFASRNNSLVNPPPPSTGMTSESAAPRPSTLIINAPPFLEDSPIPTPVSTPSTAAPRPSKKSFSRPRRGSLLYNQERNYYNTVIAKSKGVSEDFTMSMGFGLHAGWAIEGAVGSTYKVDATYLSPHVNLSARLETACKQYHADILFSDSFHELLSSSVQEKCRKIDRVTVKGSAVPVDVFTYDVYNEQIFQKVGDGAGFNLQSIKRLLSITRPSMSILKKGGMPVNAKRRVSTTADALPSPSPPTPPFEGAVDEEGRSRGRSSGRTLAGLFDAVVDSDDKKEEEKKGEEKGTESAEIAVPETPAGSELDSGGGGREQTEVVGGAARRKTSVHFHYIYNKKGGLFEEATLPTTPLRDGESEAKVGEVDNKLESNGANGHGDAAALKDGGVVGVSSVPVEKVGEDNTKSEGGGQSLPSPDLQSYYKSSVLSMLMNSFSSRDAKTSADKGEAKKPSPSTTPVPKRKPTLPAPPPDLHNHFSNNVLNLLQKRRQKEEEEGSVAGDGGEGKAGGEGKNSGGLQRYYRSSVLSMIKSFSTAKNPSPDDENEQQPGKKAHRGSNISQSSVQSASSGQRAVQKNSILMLGAPNLGGGGAGGGPVGLGGIVRGGMPRLPMPAMGSQHNAQTRLLLSGVHKELIKSHRVYIKQMQHQLKNKDENEEYQEAMRHLQTLFPTAEMIIPPYFNTAEVFNKDIDMLQLQVHISAAFKDAFTLGMNEYLKGNWQRAKKFLLKADSIMREALLAFQETPLYKQTSGKRVPGDGPSQTLLKYMEEYRFIAPKDWKGFRPLTAK